MYEPYGSVAQASNFGLAAQAMQKDRSSALNNQFVDQQTLSPSPLDLLKQRADYHRMEAAQLTEAAPRIQAQAEFHTSRAAEFDAAIKKL